MIAQNNNIGAVHIGNSLAAPAFSMDIIRDLASKLIPVLANLNGTVWLPLTCNCTFADSTRNIVMYKKIWKNPACRDWTRFHNHTPEAVIFEDAKQVSFLTILQVQSEEFLAAYEMVAAYNQDKFIMIVPPGLEMPDYMGLLTELFHGHQKNGLIDIRSLLEAILNTMDDVVVSSTWGFADDWDCGIGFYSNRNNSLFNKLSNSLMNEFSTCKNVIIETEPDLYL